MKIQINNSLPIKELEIPEYINSPSVYTFGVIDGFKNNVDVYEEDEDYLNGVMYGKELLYNEKEKYISKSE